MKQKTEIEIEVSETLMYASRSERFESFCPECRSSVEMATPRAASIMTRSTERAIFRYVETGDLHFIERDRVLVCMTSLSKKLSNSPVPSGRKFFK